METSEPKYARSWGYRFPLLLLAVFTIVLGSMHIRALSYTDESCDIPLRQWMTVTALTLFLAGVPWLFVESCFASCLAGNKATNCYKAYYIILGCFLGIWSALGMWMLSSDDTCARDFSNGYDISMVTCGIFFVFVGVTMPFGFCARACGWLETKKEGYEPVG